MKISRTVLLITAAAVTAGAIATGVVAANAAPSVAPHAAPNAAPQAAKVQAAAVHIKDNSNGLNGPLGDVIGTGVRTHNGLELVIFGASGITIGKENSYGFALGERLADGDVTEWCSINEDPDVVANTAPGFHATQEATGMEDGDAMPAFGYYVGTPAKITAKYKNKTVTAKTAVWSYDTSVTVFWFDLADVPADSDLGRPHAYDAAGTELPAGNNKVHGII
jgi:hypothetical protein